MNANARCRYITERTSNVIYFVKVNLNYLSSLVLFLTAYAVIIIFCAATRRRRQGALCARTPLFPQFAISNPLRLSRIALRLAHLICSLASPLAPFTGRRSFRPPKPRQGALSSVRNIKSAASLAHGASTCAFDLLTGLSTRTVHRTVLISGPRRHRVGGKVISSSRRLAAVMPGSAQIHISRIKSILGLNCYRFLERLCVHI